MTLRRFVLWLTGRDLLEPKLPESPHIKFKLAGPPTQRWELTFSKDAYVRFNLPDGPNALHRAMQRLVLGIRWRML